jgi:hypothetical protein
MKKSELRTMIREVLKEELSKKKSLTEGYKNIKSLVGTELNSIVDNYNNTYAGVSLGHAGTYPGILDVCYSHDPGCCDIILKLDAPIKKELLYITLFRLFEDYTGDSSFEELLGFSWLALNDSAIAFWFGRIENFGIETGLDDEE